MSRQNTHRPEVWFAIPSASVDRCRRSLPAWRERGYKIAILQNNERGDVPADRVVWRDAYPGWAESINILCREVVPPTADIVVSGGDDMLPDPDRSAADIGREFLQRFPSGLGVMQPTGDAFLGARYFCGSPWLGRGWIERANRGRGPMWPEYRHNWADNELFWVAKAHGLLWERPDLSQHHDHFSRTGEAPPEYWEREVKRNDEADVQLFIARLWQRFPGCELTGRGQSPAGTGQLVEEGEPRFDAAVLSHEGRGIAEAYWMSRYGMARLAATSERKFREALTRARDSGCSRLAIYGAGSHTRLMWNALMQPPLPVACIIDDNPTLRGGSLWNYPIVDQAGALALGVDGVVISSNTMEDELVAQAAAMESRGARVFRVYAATEPSSPARSPSSAGSALTAA
ncbi:MAG: hypothetical protein SFZ23_03145 [Planctomycetota bacterium]|nr:hypothetical protein [Planctomycetota bacterium]